MSLRKNVNQFLKQSSLQKYADELTELIKPSIRIKTHADSSLSQSHFGGLPKAPPSFEFPKWDITPYLQSKLKYYQTKKFNSFYPDEQIAKIQQRSEGDTIVPLTYFGQIHLDEIPQSNSLLNLPKTGVLYFFYDFVNVPPGRRPSSRGGWRCIYLDVSSNELESANDYCESCEIFPHRSLTFSLEWMFGAPEYKAEEILGYQISDQELRWLCFELRKQFEIYQPTVACEIEHRLFGYPGIIQEPMERMCQLSFHGIEGYAKQSEEIENGVKDWLLLLQLDSDDNLDWQFGDTGRIFFWIRQQDLEKQDFSNIWCEFQSA